MSACFQNHQATRGYSLGGTRASRQSVISGARPRAGWQRRLRLCRRSATALQPAGRRFRVRVRVRGWPCGFGTPATLSMRKGSGPKARPTYPTVNQGGTSTFWRFDQQTVCQMIRARKKEVLSEAKKKAGTRFGYRRQRSFIAALGSLARCLAGSSAPYDRRKCRGQAGSTGYGPNRSRAWG